MHMEPKLRFVVTKGVRHKYRIMEYVLDMGQRHTPKLVVSRDAPM